MRPGRAEASTFLRRAAWARASVLASAAEGRSRAPAARRCSFQVAEIRSFCWRTKSSTCWPAALAAAWLCAMANSSTNGVTSRKNMSLRVSVERLPRAMSCARA